MHRLLLISLCLSACHDNSNGPDASSGDDAALPDAPPDGSTEPVLPELAFCKVANPANLAAVFVAQSVGDAVSYTCAESCADWTTCTFGMVNTQGPLRSARGNMQIQGLAFVVDGMAGHMAFTPDGDDVVVTHAGSGGTSVYNLFDRQLQQLGNLKTVSLGWERGTPAIFGGGGWFTRTDAQPTTVRALAARPAAAIKWIKDHFAAGKKLGTVGSSMGTMATFGAQAWYGLEPIIDYQMLIGGPGFWDVNLGCGRVHTDAGHCDLDVAACTGNPASSYGNDDPTCGTPTNSCRTPTVMAPLAGGNSAYNSCINYVGMTTACTAMSPDVRDPSLDASSLATTVASWTFHGRIDFVANEGGNQPPNADQGMGEGHMMELYQHIQSAKGWIDNQGAHHGDAWDSVPTLVDQAARVVVTGMGQ